MSRMCGPFQRLHVCVMGMAIFSGRPLGGCPAIACMREKLATPRVTAWFDKAGVRPIVEWVVRKGVAFCARRAGARKSFGMRAGDHRPERKNRVSGTDP